MYFDPLMMRELFADLGSRTRQAFAALLPGPVTLVAANPAHRYPLACRSTTRTAGDPPDRGPAGGRRHPDLPDSANRSGSEAPATYDEVDPFLVDSVDLAIDGGELTGLPSTVIDLTELDADGGWAILREGALADQEVTERLTLISSVPR